MQSISKLSLKFFSFTLLFSAFSAQADWQAKVHTEVTGKQIAPIDGTMWVSEAGVRIDVSTPTSISMIVQTKKKKAFTLLHAAKMVMESDLKQYQSHIPACSTGMPSTCYQKLGIKKTGSETIDGVKCDIWEGTIEGSKTKIWHPETQKEGPPLRSVVHLKDGGKVESKFSEIVVKAIPASSFNVPAGYKAGGPIEDLVKSVQGLSN